MRRFLHTILALFSATLLLTACSSEREQAKKENIIFGINADNYTLERKKVESGESWSKILGSYGIGTQKLVRLDQLTREICPLRTIRAGAHYTTFTRQDSTSVTLDHLVYEKN
ncbi:MAG: metalloendopeptidase, partial [Alistipes sp.]|nr:metalloendopeptidase [Alistipes sp.]